GGPPLLCDGSCAWESLLATLLEDAPQPSRHAAEVVRVARGVGLHPFPTAPRETDFKESLSAKAERGAHTDAGLQSGKPEIARVPAHLAKLTKYPHPERVHDLPLVAHLVRHEIAVTKAIVDIAPQQVLIVNVGAAQCRLKIERHTVP